MKKRFTEEQIRSLASCGRPKRVCRSRNCAAGTVSRKRATTYYLWRSLFGGFERAPSAERRGWAVWPIPKVSTNSLGAFSKKWLSCKLDAANKSKMGAAGTDDAR